MSNFEIKQQFVVDGQAFDTVEAAEAYIASNATRVRVVAFTEHLKANGAKRISKAITDAVEQFIAFEEGGACTEPKSPGIPDEELPPELNAPGKPASDTPTEKETSGASEEPAVNVSEGTSKYVAGPDEDLDEDPLAGLDLESLED